jgi:hypothetical protein
MLLTPQTVQKLKMAKLPNGSTSLTITGKMLAGAIGEALIKRITDWWVNSYTGKHSLTISDFDGWFSISQSAEYGRTLWQPYVAAGSDAKACIVFGYSTVPLADFVNYRIEATEDLGYQITWDLSETDEISIPIRLEKDIKVPGLKDLRLLLKSNESVAGILREPVIIYPKLTTLDLGTYQVVDTFTYKGYQSIETGLVLKDKGRYQGNSITTDVLATNPVITEDSPAILTVLSHGTTKQGYAKAVVTLDCKYADVDDAGFDFSLPTGQVPLLEASDDEVLDFDTVIEVEAEPDPETETETEPKPKRSRKR